MSQLPTIPISKSGTPVLGIISAPSADKQTGEGENNIGNPQGFTKVH